MTSHGVVFSKIVTQKIQDSTYWKLSCHAINAETFCERAVDLNCIGALDNKHQPTKFLCLLYKLILMNPEQSIIEEFLHQPWFKYLTAVAAVYIRLIYKATDVYKLLEPLYADFRKLRVQDTTESITTVDQLIDQLLTNSKFFTLAMPHLTKRQVLETKGLPKREPLL